MRKERRTDARVGYVGYETLRRFASQAASACYSPSAVDRRTSLPALLTRLAWRLSAFEQTVPNDSGSRLSYTPACASLRLLYFLSMPEKKVACFCGIWCAAPRTVSATTRRKHCKVVEEVGGVVMPPYEPGTGSVNEESWKRHALENSRMYAASRAKGSAQKRRADDHGAAKKHPRTDAPSTMQTVSCYHFMHPMSCIDVSLFVGITRSLAEHAYIL